MLRLGSMVARLKLKGIDGGSHKRWRMLLNSKQREEPYLGLTCRDYPHESGGIAFGCNLHRCCMAVVSSCLEVLG